MFRDYIRVIRRTFWRVLLGLKFTDKTFLCGGFSRISKDFVAGKFSYVGPSCSISNGVSLGDYSMIGPNVMIVGNDHVFDVVGNPVIFSGRPEFKSTVLGKDVWVGAGAIILCGVSIGDGSIVGAGSVVTKNIPSNSVVAGTPARVIRARFNSEDWSKHLQSIENSSFLKKYPDSMKSK